MASMSILDDAIREHLELKRAHGADEAELKKLEDEAFGPPARPDEPDPFAEAPTEFMATEAPAAAEAAGEETGGRRINIADLQEPPEPKAAEAPAAEVEVTATDEAPVAEAAPVAPAEDPAQAAPPAEEEPLAMEREAAPEAAAAEAGIEQAAEASHSTEERHAIAEQPTELFDIEAEMGTEDAPATEAPSPSDEEIVDAEAAEPKLAPVEPPTEIYASRAEAPAEPAAEEEEEDEEFWSDQRLSEELDQALEAPLTDEHDVAPAPAAEPAAPLFDRAEDREEDEQREGDRPEHEEFEPKQQGHEDVLEDTPDFLEDAPEDDELWFEQRPPKDFDLD
jgi:hypothetical protein